MTAFLREAPEQQVLKLLTDLLKYYELFYTGRYSDSYEFKLNYERCKRILKKESGKIIVINAPTVKGVDKEYIESIVERTIKPLSSAEIRELLLETLSYEDADIDSDGKTFKKYGYQGTQSDLYRLAEGLAIKKGMIPNNIKVSGGAWGGSGSIQPSWVWFRARGELKCEYLGAAAYQSMVRSCF